MTGTAGYKDDSVRSDCFVSVAITKKTGIKIDLQSKVKSLYGNSIENLCQDILQFFDIGDANVSIIDKGALDFVIAARLEAAIKKVMPTDKEYLLPFLKENSRPAEREKTRRSRLYLPGNTPKLMINAGIHSADGIILDLEDSVAPDRKEEARILVRNALRSVNFYDSERMVRINQVPEGLSDLQYIVHHNVHVILIPKCETPRQLALVDEKIAEINKTPEHNIFLMPLIESALGVINAFHIAMASKNVVALTIGLEDYTADIGAPRTEKGLESFYARSTIVNAASAARIQAIDSVYSDVANTEGLKENITGSKALGFVGMGCIHPRQIQIINEGFNPDPAEIEKARKIVLAFEDAERKGLGVVALHSKMIDPPVVKRAIRTINTAIDNGLINQNWREVNHE